MESKSKRNMYINIVINVFMPMAAVHLFFHSFLIDGNLYNALMAGDVRTWRDWVRIYSAVWASPLILIALVQAVRSVWDGSMFSEHLPARKKR